MMTHGAFKPRNFLIAAMGLFFVSPSMAAEPVRITPLAKAPVQTIPLDGTWQFRPDTGALKPAEIDAEAAKIAAAAETKQDWHPLAVPQFLNRYAWWLDISQKFVAADKARLAALPFDAEKTQAGWYLKRIELPEISGPAPEVVVSFEGVAMLSRVYCNGHHVGGHVGMFGEFECRLTPHLKWGQGNTLVVYAERGNTVANADEVVSVAVTVPVTRGMLNSLNHGMFGGFGRHSISNFLGIWQPVTLKVSQSGGRIADAFFQPALDGHRIDVTLENPGDAAVSGRLHYQLRERDGGALLHEETLARPLELAAGESRMLTLEKSALAPKLWSPDFPNLYDLNITWKSADDSRMIDQWTHAVGYRTVTVKGDRLYLNGHPYWTRGAGMPVYGYKPNDEATARGFLRRMREGNQAVTRSGCNPWNELWYRVADEEGVGIANEGVRPWALMSKEPPPPPPILAQWKAEQIQSVRQYRNHPSILFYCVSNEGMQGDHHNEEKLAIFKDIMDAMREVDPTRPICQTSGEPDYGGHADIEDVHSYWGWYEPSSFARDYTTPQRGLFTDGKRPFINKETAVPYQDTDNGAVHPAYIRYYSAHPWVGELGIRADKPAYFAEHVRAETKLKTEKLRRQRKQLPTAGMIIFANTTWIGDVLTAAPDQWKPFPVWDAARQAMEPVLAGWTTTQHVFFAGGTVKTNAFVVNDDARFHDLTALKLKCEVLDTSGQMKSSVDATLGDVAYDDSNQWPMEITIPDVEGAGEALTPATVRLTLSDARGVVSQNAYPIRIATRAWSAGGGNELIVAAEGCSENVMTHLRALGGRVLTLAEATTQKVPCDAVLLGPQATAIGEDAARAVLKPGGRLIALQQGPAARRFCPELFPIRPLAWTYPTGYQVLPQGFRDGARWTSDRDITFPKVPARFAGATAILTRMDDKAVYPDMPHMRFHLTRQSTVAVAFDSRAATLPVWLQEWKKTGETLETSTGFKLHVYEKSFPAGEVVLGGNGVPNALAMYAVAVLPAEGGAVERLQIAREGQTKVGEDNPLDHFMFDKATPERIGSYAVSGEFVEMLGWENGGPFFAGLDAMDWKWWANGEGRPALACTAAHRIDITRSEVIPLGRYLQEHFYWSGDLKQVYESKLTYPVFAVKRPWGELLVCDLAITNAVAIDPRAARTLSNLLLQDIRAGAE